MIKKLEHGRKATEESVLINILSVGALPYDLKGFNALLRLTEDTDHYLWL
jgi:hypothetical protein